MYRYGIVSKSGDCQIVKSELNLSNFMNFLERNNWVYLNYSVPLMWSNNRDSDRYFSGGMFSIKNIESISCIEVDADFVSEEEETLEDE